MRAAAFLRCYSCLLRRRYAPISAFGTSAEKHLGDAPPGRLYALRAPQELPFRARS